MGKLDVSLLLLRGPCHVFEADTGEAMVLMRVNQPFKACNDFIVRKSQAGNVKAQHPRDHLSEICQLREQTEGNKLNRKQRRCQGKHVHICTHTNTSTYITSAKYRHICCCSTQRAEEDRNSPLGHTSNHKTQTAEVSSISNTKYIFQVFL